MPRGAIAYYKVAAANLCYLAAADDRIRAMSAPSQTFRFLTRAGIIFGALFAVTIVLAAIPGHRAPAVSSAAQEAQSASASGGQEMDRGNGQGAQSMPGMEMSAEKASEHAAMEDMAGMHGANPHMYMTALRPQTPEDVQRAHEIVEQLRAGMEKYRDYHVALNEGYKIFMPNVPQREYHFTNYGKGFLEAFRFDPAQPTSLLYKKTAEGYELVGAMYTMPKRASEEQLNERVPLSVAHWHLHTNLCMPPRAEWRTADWTRFGLRGSIATEQACDAAGGRFQPVIFGWMVHVYPYESSLDKIFAMHHD